MHLPCYNVVQLHYILYYSSRTTTYVFCISFLAYVVISSAAKLLACQQLHTMGSMQYYNSCSYCCCAMGPCSRICSHY